MESPAPDCREVLAKLYLFLDREIGAIECTSIETHLTECQDCMHHADFERAFIQIVGRKCTERRTPPELLERLRARMRET
ncbi:MAG: mycothiol system anti-sigma-R factor [Actinomycetota bacterium]